MGMMPIIASHFIQNYGRGSHITPMPIRAKDFGRTRKGKVWPTKG
jgi:hypothetical protein